MIKVKLFLILILQLKLEKKVLLTGDSGTGKSTLFAVLLGKLKAQSGTVTYLDKNNQPLENATVGYLPQDPVVFSSFN